jgi:catechol 2,3-dioxygenase
VSSIDPALRVRGVRLAVSDLDASADFYERLLGLPVLERSGERVLLGPDPLNPALELVGLESPTPAPPRSTGLFHVAWLHPTRAGLAETVRRVASAGWPFQGASDHGVSEALYLGDPDGLGIEIYTDRPRERWARPSGGNGVVMVTEPLDVENLLAQAPGEPGPQVEQGTGVGHVHLMVANVPRTLAYYAGLGFDEQARIPSAAFVSAGGYHHHIGLNSWHSAGGQPPPETAPGLRAVEFALSGPEQVLTLAGRAGVAGDGGSSLKLQDPDGQRLLFSAPQAT